MQFKTVNLILALSGSLCAAAPSNARTHSELSARGNLYTTKSGVRVGTDDGTSKAKRNVLYTTSHGVTVGSLSPDETNDGLDRRSGDDDDDYWADAAEMEELDDQPLSRRGISSCGPRSGWMPIGDNLWKSQWGYASAAKSFCHRVYTDDNGNPFLIPSKGYASSNVVFENEYSNDGARVTLKNGVPGYIEFEIHNKGDDEVRVIESDCYRYLMQMAQTNSDCYGSNNHDTKGGTWAEGHVTYHGLPKKGSP